MNTAEKGPKASLGRFGLSLGRAGEWAHYVGASVLCFEVGGPFLVVAYFALQTIPVLVLEGRGVSRDRGPLWLLAPAAIGAVALMVQFGSLQLFWIAVLGVAALGAGTGGAFAGRYPAWMAGFREGPGVAGSLGALIAVVVSGRWGLPWVLAFAALSLIAAGLIGERHEHRGPVVAPLGPAAAAMGWIAGMQVIQFALVGTPAPTGFFVLAYSIGVNFGFRAAPTADFRAILAAPFAAAAAVGALTVIQGPGLLLLWGGAAAAVGLVLGSGPSRAQAGSEEKTTYKDKTIEDGRERTRGLLERAGAARDWTPAAAGAGAMWSLSAGPLGTEPILWGGAGVALAGGFLSMHLVRSLASRPAPLIEPEPAIQTAPVLESVPILKPAPIPIPTAPISTAQLIAAAQMLLDASRTAREIRSRALKLHKEVYETDCVKVARARTVQVLDQLLMEASGFLITGAAARGPANGM